MPSPLISVVIPTFNRNSSIVASIKSVRDQSFKDLEIIVVDDGSTDNTENVVLKLGIPGLRYIRFSENRGANAARNSGIQAALGKYIAFQDSDDKWHPEKLEKQLHACKHSDAKVSFCAFNRIKEGQKSTVPKPGYNIQAGCHNLHAKILRGSFISCPTLLIEKSALLQTGLFDEELPRLQDWELCLRLSKHYPFTFIDEPLVDVALSADSITQGKTTYAEAADMILAKHVDDFLKDRAAYAILCINVSVDAFRRRNYRNFVRFSWRALYYGKLDLIRSMLILVRRR